MILFVSLAKNLKFFEKAENFAFQFASKFILPNYQVPGISSLAVFFFLLRINNEKTCQVVLLLNVRNLRRCALSWLVFTSSHSLRLNFTFLIPWKHRAFLFLNVLIFLTWTTTDQFPSHMLI